MSRILKMNKNADMMNMLMDTISAGVVQLNFDAQLSFSYLNKNGAEMLGYTQEQLQKEVNNEFIKLVYPNDRTKIQELLVSLKEQKNMPTYKHRLVCRNGRICGYRVQGICMNKNTEKK